MYPTTPIILALSGGPDSVYLLHKLLRQEHRPILAHLNHKLRGGESDKDEGFVRKLGKKHRLTVEVARKNVTTYAKRHKLSVETAARQLRYAFLEKVRQKHKAQAILTAHTLDDNLETVVMNQMRSGEPTLRAQIGMRDKTGFIERPLLGTAKKNILTHLHRHRLPYRDDASNRDLRYRRNWVRHIVIPRLLKKNPALYKEFAVSRRKALKEYARLTEWAEQWFRKNPTLELEAFSKLKTDPQRFLLQHLYEKIYGSTKGLTRKHIEEVRELLIKGKTGKQKRFGENVIVKIARPHLKKFGNHGVAPVQ